MRIVMMGTGAFAVPTFESLYATHHTVVALFTGPLHDRKSRTKVATPMRDVAHKHETAIYDPLDINAAATLDLLRSLRPDLYVVCDFGQILSAETLATARLGGVNLHCSLLPRYRGAAPANWAIYNGDETTGVSVIHMTPKVDAGPVIAQSPPEAILPDETADELKARLSEIGAWFIRRSIDSLEAGILRAIPQDASLACKAPKMKKSDGLLQWDRTATQVRDQYRAMQPWPKAYTFLQHGSEKPVRVILGPLEVTSYEHIGETAKPGTVVRAEGEDLIVAAGRGFVRIQGIQPAGKRRMTAQEFLRGHELVPGDKFVSELSEEPTVGGPKQSVAR